MSRLDFDFMEQILPPIPEVEIPRDAQVRRIAVAFDPECQKQMIIGGKQTGKTNLVAQFVRQHKDQCISYFITSSPLTQQKYAFLYSMCYQLSTLLSTNTPPESIDLENLENLFTTLSFKLVKKARKTTFYYVVDGLEQALDGQEGERIVDLFPLQTAPYSPYLLFSCRSDQVERLPFSPTCCTDEPGEFDQLGTETYLRGTGFSSDLNNLGETYRNLGETHRAIEYCERRLEIARETGDRRGEGAGLGNLGNAYATLGDARRAIGYYEQRLEISRETGDRGGEGNVLGNLGSVYLQLGDARRAIGYYEQALEILHGIGDRRREGNVLGNLGSVYLQLGDARRAIGYFEQALAIRREIGDINGVATDLYNMALLYAQQDEAARALPLAQEAARIWAQVGSPYAPQAQQLVAQLQAGAC